MSANTLSVILDFLDRRDVIHITACSKGWHKWRSYKKLTDRLLWRRQRYILTETGLNSVTKRPVFRADAGRELMSMIYCHPLTPEQIEVRAKAEATQHRVLGASWGSHTNYYETAAASFDTIALCAFVVLVELQTRGLVAEWPDSHVPKWLRIR